MFWGESWAAGGVVELLLRSGVWVVRVWVCSTSGSGVSSMA